MAMSMSQQPLLPRSCACRELTASQTWICQMVRDGAWPPIREMY